MALARVREVERRDEMLTVAYGRRERMRLRVGDPSSGMPKGEGDRYTGRSSWRKGEGWVYGAVVPEVVS